MVSYSEAHSVMYSIGQMRGSTVVGWTSGAMKAMRDSRIRSAAPTAPIALIVSVVTVLRHTRRIVEERQSIIAASPAPRATCSCMVT